VPFEIRTAAVLVASGDSLYRFDGATAEPLLHLTATKLTISAFVPLTPTRAYLSTLSDVYQCDQAGPPNHRHLYGAPLGANLSYSRLADGTLHAGIAGHGIFSGELERFAQERQTPLLQNASVAVRLQTPDALRWFATLGHYLICQKGDAEAVVTIESAAPLPTWNVTSLVRTLAITPGFTFEYDVWLTTGTTADMRARFQSVR